MKTHVLYRIKNSQLEAVFCFNHVHIDIKWTVNNRKFKSTRKYQKHE